jgi:phosphohistidine phosphatase
VCDALRKVTSFAPAEIWHSPLARSLETAGLLAKGLGLAAPVLLKTGLEPDDDPAKFLPLLEAEGRDIAAVGHEPHLGILASLMVHGPSRECVYYPFPKAAVLALTREGKLWRSEWLVRSP